MKLYIYIYLLDKIYILLHLKDIGQNLYIPKGQTVEETDYIVYQVEPSDTLYSIARRYNTNVDAIKNYNNLTSNVLTIGQNLQIPVPKVETENLTYIVKRGDTLYKIANDYGVTVLDIMNLNNMDSTLLSIGQTILIPTQKSDF